jgi:hypothetical protein
MPKIMSRRGTLKSALISSGVSAARCLPTGESRNFAAARLTSGCDADGRQAMRSIKIATNDEGRWRDLVISMLVVIQQTARSYPLHPIRCQR